MFRRKVVRASPEQDYKDGLLAWHAQTDRDDASGRQCPYKPGCRETSEQRVRWLEGYYDALVDDAELRARKALKLKPINWTPPKEEKKRKVREIE